MKGAAASVNWRERVEAHIHGVMQELEAELSSAVEAAVDSARGDAERSRDRALRDRSERLNQQVRRLRQAETRQELFTRAVEASGAWSRRAAVFVFDERGGSAAAQREMGAETIRFPSGEAPAFLTAIETRDPVVALGSASEISPMLEKTLTEGPPQRVYLFPLLVRQQVAGVLFAAEEVDPAAVELLSEVASMRLESLSAPPPQPAPDLVQIGGARGEKPAAKKVAWKDLPAGDQRLHLRAQRIARVRVAEMRVEHREAVREGVAKGDLYGALREPIDHARDEYRRDFLLATPTMVDYLYLECVRSLANEDERLLGPEFPGPLV